MPRAKLPLTPATSTEPGPQDKSSGMENAFVLPPSAMNRSPPTSPIIQRKRTLSGSTKSKDELPPPPSRARKIIQMKPKEEPPPPTTPTSTKTTSPRKKTPSATSAAGRKIARKTAHSIIERRRRSKMNEEFGVLKDMIPACNGVEMHKLAILQAGIEYVRYLEGCVDKLQDGRNFKYTPRHDEEEHVGEAMEEDQPAGKTPSASPPIEQEQGYEYRRGSTATTSTATTSAHPSPVIRPNISSSSLASQRHLPPPTVTQTYSTSPPPILVQTPVPTGVSPAFNAIHFSPDLSRTYTNQSQFGKHSPSILPLPQAAMPMSARVRETGAVQDGEGHAEATATAALMMLTNDRRSVGGSGRGGGMSVRDLLSH